MPRMVLDHIDLKILEALQTNARISNVALAEAAGISPSPCLRRVRLMQEAGVIQSMLTIVDPAAVGLDIQALIRIRIAQHGSDPSGRFERAIRAMPEVIACFLVSGSTDYVVHAVARTVASYAELVKTIGGLPGIAEIQSNIVLSTVKPWSGLPVANQTARIGDEEGK